MRSGFSFCRREVTKKSETPIMSPSVFKPRLVFPTWTSTVRRYLTFLLLFQALRNRRMAHTHQGLIQRHAGGQNPPPLVSKGPPPTKTGSGPCDRFLACGDFWPVCENKHAKQKQRKQTNLWAGQPEGWDWWKISLQSPAFCTWASMTGSLVAGSCLSLQPPLPNPSPRMLARTWAGTPMDVLLGPRPT